MKAIVKTEAGPGGIGWGDWPDPVPRAGQVVVEVKQAGICSTDVAIYKWTYRGRHPIQIPSMLGHEAAGVVVDRGTDVEDVQVGERVALQVIWGHPHAQVSMLGKDNLDPDWYHVGASAVGGAFAERIAVPADRVVLLPDAISWEDGALLEPVAVAWHALKLVEPEPGESMLVVGPGPFGLLMCQIARRSGVGKIVAVGLEGTDERRLEVARAAGADTILATDDDSSRDDTVRAIHDALGAGGADIVMDCGGTAASTGLSLEATAPGARVALFGFTPEATIEPLRQIIRRGVSLLGVSTARREHYGAARRLIETGIAAPSEIVSHRFPMADAGRGLELMATREASKVLLDP